MTDIISLFFALLVAHLLGDFALQTNWILSLKKQGGWKLLPHVLIHLCMTAVLLENAWQLLPLLLILGSTHYVIDWVKLRLSAENTLRSFWADQVAHVVVLMGLAIWFPAVTPMMVGGGLLGLFAAAFLAALCIYMAIFPALFSRWQIQLPNRHMFSISKYLGLSAVIMTVLYMM